MSRKLIDNARRRLAAETGCQPNPRGGRLSVGLVYPNTYHQAMSNLGFLSIYHLLNSRDDTRCERFFLPDSADLIEHRKTGYPLFSLESNQPLREFDLVAFSISFENDYLHLPTLLELARLPLLAAERSPDDPLLLCGGVCAFLNPEPLAEIMDLFAIGEGEVILPELLPALIAGGERGELLQRLARLPGVYVPSCYQLDYHPDGTLAAPIPLSAAPARVRRQWLADLDSAASRSFVQTEQTEFGDMALTEVSRGCSRGCRFCAAGYIYLPPRERSLHNLIAQVETGLCQRTKVGLVGAAVSDYPQLEELNQEILQRGGKISVASLRIDALTAAEVSALKASGHRTVALAPEAGSQRMRDLINKNLDIGQILHAVRLLAEGDIPNLKLYFLIGLPSETAADLVEMLELVTQIRDVWLEQGRKRGRLGTITLSINPFIPKPFTPFQWAAMEPEKSLSAKLQGLRKAVSRLGNTELICESLRSAQLQALLSRGDRRLARLLPELASGKNLKAGCRSLGLDPDFYITRERGETEVFPWEIIDSGVSREYLWREYQRGLAGQRTLPCQPGCQRCGVCG